MVQKKLLTASLICSNPIRIEEDLNEINFGKADLIHFDVMDGMFVPRYGLYPEVLEFVTKKTNIPVDVHMMTYHPEKFINVFRDAGATHYNVHVEACPQLHHVIQLIKTSGMKAGVGMNPATPVSSLEWVINDIEMVVMMAINPGIVGHKLIPNMIQKIKELREYADKKGNSDLLIEIDGGVTPESAKLMIDSGANILVCGTGSIFRPHEDTISNKIKYFRTLL